MKIYKYMGFEVVKKVFSEEGFCDFKCTYPKDFNDPYELFLTIDFQQSPEMLAYYREVVGNIPERPTTCFSKSPCIIPMWAHYANNHQGIVIEIDESMVVDHFPEISFGDVDYHDTTSEGLLELLNRAYFIGKFRYHYLLQKGVYSAAYYTKQTCWQYETERRCIAREEDVVSESGMMLLRIPVECVSALIVGHNASDETRNIVAKLASEIGSYYYELKIGRTTVNPYFIDSRKLTYEFSSGAMSICNNYCQRCNEPITTTSGLCSWCAINEQHESSAESKNSLRILQRAGLLEEYYKGMNTIGKK